MSFESFIEATRFGPEHHAAEVANFKRLVATGRVAMPADKLTPDSATVVGGAEDPFYSGPKFAGRIVLHFAEPDTFPDSSIET